MEILTFALIAAYNRHRQQERVVAEPEEFQPFDLQALRPIPKGVDPDFARANWTIASPIKSLAHAKSRVAKGSDILG